MAGRWSARMNDSIVSYGDNTGNQWVTVTAPSGSFDE